MPVSNRKIVLAIDDMSENLSLIRSMLEGFFDVRLAKSAKMAIKLLETLKVDLILLDIEMPLMNGFEFIKHIRANNKENKKTPVIFVTAHANTKFIKEAVKYGAKDYLVKPITAEVLYKKIDGVIGLPNEKALLKPTEEKARQLLDVLVSGNSTKIDILLAEIINIAGSQSADIRRFVEDIAAHIKNIEYEEAISKTKEFLAYISFNKSKIGTSSEPHNDQKVLN